MKKMVLFYRPNDVGEFVNIALTAPFDISAGKGRYIVDAKSMLGLFSLDLSLPIEIEYDETSDRYTEKAENEFLKKIEKFLV